MARGVAGGGGGGGGGVIAFRGKLKSSCSLAWKLGVMAIKSEWVIKSCSNAQIYRLELLFETSLVL